MSKINNFYFYHPFNTFSFLDDNNYSFVSPRGKSLGELNCDTESLFIIGMQAFRLLGLFDSREVFDELHEFYLELIEDWRDSLIERDNIQYSNCIGRAIKLDPKCLTESQLIAIAHQNGKSENAPEEFFELLRETYLMNVFREIDNALVALDLRATGAAVASITAANSLAQAREIENGIDAIKKARSQMAISAVAKKLRHHPKQKEKAFVRECWEGWQRELDRYPSKAAFARDMLLKCEHLKSQKKIEDWCRGWESNNGTMPAE